MSPRWLPLVPALLTVAGCSTPDERPSPAETPAVEAPAEPTTPAEPTSANPLLEVELLGEQARLVRSWKAGAVSTFAIGTQGGALLVGTEDGQVSRWILPAALIERHWEAPPQGGAGSVVAVGSWWSHSWAVYAIDGELQLVDLDDARVAATTPAPAAGVTQIHFPRDRETLLLALGDGSYASWTPPGSELEPLAEPPLESEPWELNHRFLSSGHRDDELLATRHAQPVTLGFLRQGPVALSADGRALVGVVEGRIGLWHLDAPPSVHTWEGQGAVREIAYTAGDLLVAVDRGEAGIELRDAATGTLLVSGPPPEALMGWDPFGEAAGRPTPEGLPGVAAAARSADGRWLLTADDAGALRRWEMDGLKQGRLLDTRLDRMLRADPFSPDALLARAELAAIGARWGRVADLLELAEQQGAAVHPALRIRALTLAGRRSGAEALVGRLSPSFAGDPAVQAWVAYLQQG